jgi:hypothetical protein
MNNNLHDIVLTQNLHMLKTHKFKDMCTVLEVICSGETEFHILIIEDCLPWLQLTRMMI